MLVIRIFHNKSFPKRALKTTGILFVYDLFEDVVSNSFTADRKFHEKME
jgi:hypothetical protein